MRGVLLHALLLTILTGWAYASVWSAEWVYEDRAVRTEFLAADGALLTKRSLTAWTWRLAPTPRAGHAVSLGIHLVLGGMVGLLAWRLGVPPVGIWAASTLWLLHPMTVELAAYAKARADAIALGGVLIAVLAASGRWWRGGALAGMALGVLVAVGGKQAGVVVVLLVPLMIWHRRSRYPAPRWAPWWLPAVVASALLAGGVQWYGGLRAVLNADTALGIAQVTDVSWQQWGAAQAGAVGYWAVATVWPAWMTPDADIDSVSTLLRASGLLLLVGAAGMAWRQRVHAPLVSLGCAWCVLGVLPRLLVQTPRGYLSAAHASVAFVGLALLAGVGLARVQAHWRTARDSGRPWWSPVSPSLL